jgi:hypothetical protein
VEQEEAIRRRLRLGVSGELEPTPQASEAAALVIQNEVCVLMLA